MGGMLSDPYGSTWGRELEMERRLNDMRQQAIYQQGLGAFQNGNQFLGQALTPIPQPEPNKVLLLLGDNE